MSFDPFDMMKLFAFMYFYFTTHFYRAVFQDYIILDLKVIFIWRLYSL